MHTHTCLLEEKKRYFRFTGFLNDLISFYLSVCYLYFSKYYLYKWWREHSVGKKEKVLNCLIQNLTDLGDVVSVYS